MQQIADENPYLGRPAHVQMTKPLSRTNPAAIFGSKTQRSPKGLGRGCARHRIGKISGPRSSSELLLLLLPLHRRASCDDSSRNGTGEIHHAFCHPFTALSFRFASQFAPSPHRLHRGRGGVARLYPAAPCALPLATQDRGRCGAGYRLPVHVGALIAVCIDSRVTFDPFQARSPRVHLARRVQGDRDQPIADRPVYTLWCDHVFASGFLPRLRLCPAGKAWLKSRIPSLTADRICLV